jgi:hypothetical protein
LQAAALNLLMRMILQPPTALLVAAIMLQFSGAADRS